MTNSKPLGLDYRPSTSEGWNLDSLTSTSQLTEGVTDLNFRTQSVVSKIFEGSVEKTKDYDFTKDTTLESKTELQLMQSSSLSLFNPNSLDQEVEEIFELEPMEEEIYEFKGGETPKEELLSDTLRSVSPHLLETENDSHLSLKSVVEKIKKFYPHERKVILGEILASPEETETVKKRSFRKLREDLNFHVKNILLKLDQELSSHLPKKSKRKIWYVLFNNNEHHSYVNKVLNGRFAFNLNFFKKFSDSVKAAVERDLSPLYEILPSLTSKTGGLGSAKFQNHDQALNNLIVKADENKRNKPEEYKILFGKLESALDEIKEGDWKTRGSRTTSKQKKLKKAMGELLSFAFNLEGKVRWKKIMLEFEGIKNSSNIDAVSDWNMTNIFLLDRIFHFGDDFLKKCAKIMPNTRVIYLKNSVPQKTIKGVSEEHSEESPSEITDENTSLVGHDSIVFFSDQYFSTNKQKFKGHIEELRSFVEKSPITLNVFSGKNMSFEEIELRKKFNEIIKNIVLCYSQTLGSAFDHHPNPSLRISNGLLIKTFEKTNQVMTLNLWEKLAENIQIPSDLRQKVREYL